MKTVDGVQPCTERVRQITHQRSQFHGSDCTRLTGGTQPVALRTVLTPQRFIFSLNDVVGRGGRGVILVHEQKEKREDLASSILYKNVQQRRFVDAQKLDVDNVKFQEAKRTQLTATLPAQPVVSCGDQLYVTPVSAASTRRLLKKPMCQPQYNWLQCRKKLVYATG